LVNKLFVGKNVAFYPQESSNNKDIR